MAPLLQAQFADLACWSGAVFCSAYIAVDIGLLALTGSANRVPFWFSGYDAFDFYWVVPVPGLTGFAIIARRARNLLKLIPQLNLGRPSMPTMLAHVRPDRPRHASSPPTRSAPFCWPLPPSPPAQAFWPAD